MRFDGLPVKDLYVTFRREIGPDHDANFSKIRPKQRTSIRAAQKRGLSWRTGGAELVDRFYPIYSESVRNLGTPVFPKRLFQILMEEHAGERHPPRGERRNPDLRRAHLLRRRAGAAVLRGDARLGVSLLGERLHVLEPHVPCGRPRLHGLRLRAEQARHRGVPLQAALGVRADAARLSVRAGARSRRPRPEPEEPALLAGHPRLEADPPLDRGASDPRSSAISREPPLPRAPDPLSARQGGQIRSYHQLRFLAARHRVHLVCFADDRRDLAHADVLREFCASVDVVYRSGRAARIAGLRGLLDGRAISIAAFDSGALRRAAAARLRGADAVLAFSSVMAPYAPAAEGRPRVMDFVDADSEKWRDYAARSAGPAAWIYAREADRLGRFETAVASSWDQSLFVCEREARVIRARAPGPRSG